MKKDDTTLTADEFDRRCDEGESVTDFLDWEKTRRPGLEQRRANVDLPGWMIPKDVLLG